MQTRFKLATATALLVSVFAVASASASAAQWYVNAKPLSEKPTEVIGGASYAAGEEGIAEKSITQENLSMEFAGLKITCTSVALKGGHINASGTSGAASMILGGCKASGACTVPTSIETKAITLTPIVGTTDKLIIAPVGTLFWSLRFEGAECSLKGNHEVTGKVTANALGLGTEMTEQEVAVNSAGELKMGTWPMTFKAKVKFHTSASRAFSFR
jgi:hypothetical protein